MLTRSNDQTLEFDYARVLEQSKDNPVFYVQYAHARCKSVLRHAEADFPEIARRTDLPLDRLAAVEETGLIKLMAHWPRAVEQAALAHEPHRIAFYLRDLAAGFHGLWTKGKEEADLRFLRAEDPESSAARLGLIRAVASVLAAGLGIMGVVPVEEMR
jgi:arginyl-tRNA synthetase